MDASQRVGDAEREQATSLLAQHYADGRLEHEEYDERLDAIWTARTRQDLAVLFNDLPRQVAPPRPVTVPPAASRGRRPIPWLPVLAILIGLTILLDGAPVWLLIFFLPMVNGRRSGHRGSAHGCAPHGPASPRR